MGSEIGNTKSLVQRGYVGGARIESVAKANAEVEMQALADLKAGRASAQQIADRLGLSVRSVDLLLTTAGRYADSGGNLSDKGAESLRSRLVSDETSKAFFFKRIIDEMFSKMLKNFGG